MSELSNGISPILFRVEPMAPAKTDLMPLKISNLPQLFAPSEKPAFPLASKMGTPLVNPGLVVQVFTSRRAENTPTGPAHATVYHIGEAETLESLDGNEEPPIEDIVEPIDEEMDEKEDSEETALSDNKQSTLQEGEFLNEEESNEAVFEALKEETLADQTAKKMWQKARLRLLESLEQKRKSTHVSMMRSNPVSYFFLLSR